MMITAQKNMKFVIVDTHYDNDRCYLTFQGLSGNKNSYNKRFNVEFPTIKTIADDIVFDIGQEFLKNNGLKVVDIMDNALQYKFCEGDLATYKNKTTEKLFQKPNMRTIRLLEQAQNKQTIKTTKQEIKKIKKLSFRDSAYAILKINGKDMHAKDLIKKMLASGFSTAGKTPQATLEAAIGTEIKNKGNKSRFVRNKPSTFGLSEWYKPSK